MKLNVTITVPPINVTLTVIQQTVLSQEDDAVLKAILLQAANVSARLKALDAVTPPKM